MSQLTPERLQLLEQQLSGIDADYEHIDDGSGTPLWQLLVPFECADVGGWVEVFVEASTSVSLEFTLPIHDIDEERLDDFLDARCSDWGLHIDEEQETVDVILTSEVSWEAAAQGSLAVDIDHLANLAIAAVEAGLLSLTNVSALDESFRDDVGRLAALKAVDANGAAELAAELAHRARELGDYSLAATVDLAAAEVFLDLGRISEAFDRAEASWKLLGQPVDYPDAVNVYAAVLARVGRDGEALSLLDQSLEVVTDGEGRASLMGNRGGILASIGRRAEGIDWMSAALQEPAIAEQAAQAAISNLRQFGVEPDVPIWVEERSDDTLSQIEDDMSRLATQLDELTDVSEMLTMYDEAWETIARARAEWERIGPAQQIRLLLIEGALLRNDRDAAARAFDEAALIAAEFGDHYMIRGTRVARQAALLDAADPSVFDSLDPFEAIAIRMNRALALLTELTFEASVPEVRNSAAVLLEELLEVAELADAQRFEFRNVTDRQRWGSLTERVREGAVLLAHGLEKADIAGRVLELMRSQGLVDLDKLAASGEEYGGPTRDPSVATLAHHRSGDLPVNPRRPGFVNESVRSLAQSVGGATSWWWSNQLIAHRYHWCVSSPNGQTWSGLFEDLDNELTHSVEFFDQSVAASESDAHAWGIGPADLDDMLKRLATTLIPEPLRDALNRAARSGQPLNLVYAAGQGMASLPIVLLPLDDDTRLVKAAVVTLAPPFPQPADGRNPLPVELPRPLITALGTDPRLGSLDNLVGVQGLGLAPHTVLGSELHVQLQIAAAVATPSATLAMWQQNPNAVGLYYGHVLPSTRSSPLAAGLQLAGEHGMTKRLSASDILRTNQQAPLPHTVVLAGCSSLASRATGGGEWWGVACALLHGGSTFVVGSQWDVVHSTANVSFVAQLAAALRSSADAPSVLRELQLNKLREWKRDATAGRRSSEADPSTWAAYSVIGWHPVILG